jgi:hypothetical protein
MYKLESHTQKFQDVEAWNKKVYMRSGLLPATSTTPAPKRDDHSPIGFSGWDRHSACPGSVALATLCPKSESSAAADEGTLAHHVAASWLMTGSVPSGTDKKMADFLRPYVKGVWSKLPRIVTKAIWVVEGSVAAPSIHKDVHGTADCIIWDDHEKTLHVFDLKYGKYPVDVVGNQQLMGYAMCALETWPELKPKKIILYIHQPRLSQEFQGWETDPLDIDVFREDVIETVAEVERQKKILKKTKDPKKLTLNAGDHCHWCPARLMCHERMDAAKREGIDVLMPVPKKLGKDAGKLVRFALKALPMAQAVIKAAKEHLLKGGRIDGVRLIQGKRVRVPVRKEDLLDELTLDADLGGIGLEEEQIMITPKPRMRTLAQLAEIVPRTRKAAFDKLWKWQDGAPKLVVEETPGKDYRISADDYFKALPEGEEEAEDE